VRLCTWDQDFLIRSLVQLHPLQLSRQTPKAYFSCWLCMITKQDGQYAEILRSAAGVILVFLTFLSGTLLALRFNVTLRVGDRWADQTISSAEVDPDRPELVMVFIGSPDCAWSNDRGLPKLLTDVVESLSKEAQARGAVVRTIGVSANGNANAGTRFLNSLFPFDEVIAGGRHKNLGIAHYVSGHLAGPAATPQFVITFHPGGADGSREHVLLRRVGLPPMTEWLKGGAILPRVRDS
jgi:hypothetical protein